MQLSAVASIRLRSRAAPNADPPWFGELTASRWAFEALAVEQYQANAYQRPFEAVDRELSGLDFLVHARIPALLGRIDALLLAAPPGAAFLFAAATWPIYHGRSPERAFVAQFLIGWVAFTAALLLLVSCAVGLLRPATEAARRRDEGRRD